MNATNTAQSADAMTTPAKPTAVYKRRAWTAMAGLAVFLILYFTLAGWFLLTAYRLTFGAAPGAKNAVLGYMVALAAAFLAVFMLKAVFFVKRGNTDDAVEITPQQQPRLFEFLHRLADQAGAPRPHKVFLSSRVNAMVFYDLSLLNLLFPSKKNLEIGMGLVNSLTLGEFRAVLAHEFGHFTQRAMAVGRWVYTAQQIAANLVARRDKLDDFLRGLSHIDLRIAWVGWLLSLIVWSIRSLVDSAFRRVVLMQRALSREMEMQADLVAVSLTGSDALINALHRLQASDDAWERTLRFVQSEKARGRVTRDVFAIQSKLIEHMGRILNDPSYGQVPPLPGKQPEAHRLFKPELAQPPQMWLTHPFNHEREANAKRRYIGMPIDERSAWEIFDDTAALREQVSAKLLSLLEGVPGVECAPVAPEDSLQALDRQFDCEYFKGRYRGIYLGRSVVRCASASKALYEAGRAEAQPALDRLYPASLEQDVERLRNLEKELGQLRALHAGELTSPGNVIRHRGRELKPRELPKAVARVEGEVAAVEGRLRAHDRLCRSAHRAAAASLGNGWPEYLEGLLAALHYADHTEANLRDAQRLLANAVNIETATRRVSASGVKRVVNAANELHRVLAKVFEQKNQVVLDSTLTQRLKNTSWAEALGELKLSVATKENISQWLNVVDSWVDQAAGACKALSTSSLEQLLVSEATVAGYAAQGGRPEPAPMPSRVPSSYDLLLPGKERKLQTRLGWWARFQTADGLLPGAARLVVAGGIVAAVLGLGSAVGSATVTVYNGLACPVVVQLGDASVQVSPHASVSRQVDADRAYTVEARTQQGRLIESFNAEVRGSFANFVYNVAGAGPLIEWTAVYGNGQHKPERLLGIPRWSPSSVDSLFCEPPQTVNTKSGGATREVLTGFGDASPSRQLNLLKNEADQKHVINAHARWDATKSVYILQWLELAKQQPEYPALLADRLKETPDDVIILRTEQDSATENERANVCARHLARAESAPQNPDLKYLAARCMPESPAKTQAFLDGHRQWPEHGWFAYAAGHSEAQAAHWPEALAAFEQARSKVPSLRDSVSIDAARIRRLLQQNQPTVIAELAKGSEQLRFLLALENGEGLDTPALKAYPELGRGNLEQAVQRAGAEPERGARLLRLAAASDGASPDLIAKALALDPKAGLDDSTVWASIGLAARMKQDLARYLQAVQLPKEQAEHVLRFVEAVRKGKNLDKAERMLDGLSIHKRGQYYSIGLIMLGGKAPQAWRDAAKRLLFASERPYFI